MELQQVSHNIDIIIYKLGCTFFIILSGGEDYVPFVQSLIFNADSNSVMCTPVAILPDDVAENMESFYIGANSSDVSASFSLSEARVVILDNDSKFITQNIMLCQWGFCIHSLQLF